MLKESIGLQGYYFIAKTAMTLMLTIKRIFENKPEPTKNWTIKDLKAYEELKKFINKSVTLNFIQTKKKKSKAIKS